MTSLKTSTLALLIVLGVLGVVLVALIIGIFCMYCRWRDLQKNRDDLERKNRNMIKKAAVNAMTAGGANVTPGSHYDPNGVNAGGVAITMSTTNSPSQLHGVHPPDHEHEYEQPIIPHSRPAAMGQQPRYRGDTAVTFDSSTDATDLPGGINTRMTSDEDDSDEDDNEDDTSDEDNDDTSDSESGSGDDDETSSDEEDDETEDDHDPHRHHQQPTQHAHMHPHHQQHPHTHANIHQTDDTDTSDEETGDDSTPRMGHNQPPMSGPPPYGGNYPNGAGLLPPEPITTGGRNLVDEDDSIHGTVQQIFMDAERTDITQNFRPPEEEMDHLRQQKREEMQHGGGLPPPSGYGV